MTPQELKNSILQRAIQGKLVEQRPEEGTGEELYRQIQDEKQKLINEGKIKAEKPLPEITEDEVPFEIPESWKWVFLGYIGDWSSGATPSRTKQEYYGGDIPWLKTGDLNDGYVSDVPEYITELALTETSVRLNPIGSVLMAMYGATIGKLAILKTPMTTNQACCACIPYYGIDNRYLFFFLMAFRQRFIKMGEGGAQPNISKEKIVNTIFPLPPLAEQKRIVTKIEELLPLIDRYEKAWTKLEDFNKRFPVDMQKSILQLAIQGKLVEQHPEEGTGEELYQQIQTEKQKLCEAGKIKKQISLEEITEDETSIEIPSSWRWVKLQTIAKCITDGEHKTPHRISSYAGYYLLSARNIKDGFIQLDDVDYVDENEYNIISKRCNPQKGDLLISCSGSVGRVAVIKDENKYVMVRSAAMVSPIDVDSDYLMYVMQSGLLQEQMKNRTKQTAQANLFQAAICNLVIPLPPLAEQKRIVAKIEELLPLCERLKLENKI